MPAIIIEEDYDDEVSRLLSGIPRVKSASIASITAPSKGSEEKTDSLSELQQSVGSLSNPPLDKLYRSIDASNSSSIRFHSTPRSFENLQNLRIQGMDAIGAIGDKIGPVIRLEKLENRLDNLEAVMKDDGSLGVSMGGSLGSTFELCSIPSYVDPLNASIGRSRRSLDRSIGNSMSSRHRYGTSRIGSTNQSQLNRSIGGITSSKHKGGNIDQSTHSKASKLAEVVVVPKTESIDKKYFVDHSREIGRGTKTIVRKCIERSTGNRYAVKSVRKDDREEYENMRKEANLLNALDHPSIIKIYDTYEDDKHLHMVVEICKGGELYDHVVKPLRKKKNVELNCPSEQVAAVIVRCVVDAVAYLHEHNIVHRDLKVSPSLDRPCGCEY